MDAPKANQHVESRNKEEDRNGESAPLLAAYRDEVLSLEAAEQLVRLAEDASCPACAGEALPVADKAALLRKAALSQKK